MVKILQALLEKLYGRLPDSPFQALWDGLELDFIPWINWFIPFDLCFKITEAWVTAIAVYYLFIMLRTIIFDLIIRKLID